MKIYDEIDNLEQSLANYKRKSDFKKYEPYVNKDSLQSKALFLVNILAKIKAPKASGYKLRIAKLLADNAWTEVGNIGHLPTAAIDAYYIMPNGNVNMSDFSISSKYHQARISLNTGNRVLHAAAISGSVTLPANTVLVIKYK